MGRLRYSYVGALVLTLGIAAALLIVPRVQHWIDVQRHADIRQAEAILRGFDSPTEALKVDLTATACHGAGDLCVQSPLTPKDALRELSAAVGRVGIHLGRISCGRNARAASFVSGTCQATGGRGRADLWAASGTQVSRYWPMRTWAMVVVTDPDFPREGVLASHPPTVTARSLLPPAWHAVDDCLHGQLPPICGVQVTVSGTVAQAIDALARRLTAAGYGMDAPIFRPYSLCRPAKPGHPAACSLIGYRYFGAHGTAPVTVAALLFQTSKDAVTGRVRVDL